MIEKDQARQSTARFTIRTNKNDYKIHLNRSESFCEIIESLSVDVKESRVHWFEAVVIDAIRTVYLAVFKSILTTFGCWIVPGFRATKVGVECGDDDG